MIKNFAHKGLEEFFLTGSTKGIQAKHAGRLQHVLTLLDYAQYPKDMDFHGSCLHRLKGKLQDHWSVRISGNWRVTFRIENGDAHAVNYQDYH